MIMKLLHWSAHFIWMTYSYLVIQSGMVEETCHSRAMFFEDWWFALPDKLSYDMLHIYSETKRFVDYVDYVYT